MENPNKPSMFRGSPYMKKQQVIKILEQTGKKPSMVRDLSRKALAPGQRISKTGKVYWETRKNRSDRVGEQL